jgi:fructose-bisphosphate aldolase class I
MSRETLGPHTARGETFPAFLARQVGVVPGVTVDRGLIPLCPGSREPMTEGLDVLAKRLAGYREQGA